MGFESKSRKDWKSLLARRYGWKTSASIKRNLTSEENPIFYQYFDCGEIFRETL